MESGATSVLIFYPHNFSQAKSGTEKRFIELLEYFRDRNIPTDVFTLSGYSGPWTESDLQAHSRLARRIYVYPWPDKYRLLWRKIRRRIAGTLPNHALPGLKREFRKTAIDGQYSHIVISYAHWADLIDGIGNAVTVLDLLDILTFNIFHQSKASQFRLGKMFESEVGYIGKFQFALSIAPNETAMLRTICPGTEFCDVPMSLPALFEPMDALTYDLIFVGSSNPFNNQGINWFLSEVFPRLGAGVRLVVIGKVCDSIQTPPVGVTLLPYVDSVSDFYRQSRLALCPLFGGSGLKIKLVEALAHGRPVVATDLGLTGFPDYAGPSGCIRANTPEEFSTAVLALLADPAKLATAAEDACTCFERCFGRDKAWSALDTVFVHPIRRGL